MMEGDGKPKLALLAVEEKMRVQIRSLQEKRAAAMMVEISELQKDRDLTAARVVTLEKVITSLQNQNGELKRKDKKRQLLLNNLERSFKEEQLITRDLKKKLQKQVDASRKGERSCQFLHPNLTLEKDGRSHSMSDLRNIVDTNKHEKQTNSPKFRSRLTSSPCISPSSSPSFVVRRYKLASANVTSDQETQTESIAYDDPTAVFENLPLPVLEVLAIARQDLLKVQDQNKKLQIELQLSRTETQKLEIDIRRSMEECSVLRDSLSRFSQWVQEKISSVEEDIDICKVIYSLHGSLSQERELIQELRDKLSSNEAATKKIAKEKKALAKSYAEIEQRLHESENEVSELKEELQCVSHSAATSQYKTLYNPSSLLQQKDVSLKMPLMSVTKHSHL